MTRRPRILLIQTQAENAGAQEISRLVGAGLSTRGYDVHNLFFFRQSATFDVPPKTQFCCATRPGTPLAFMRFLRALIRAIRAVRPDGVLTFQHYGNAIGAVASRVAARAPVIANQVSARATMPRWLQIADVAIGMLGFYRVVTVNSRQMLAEYLRYPSAYRKRVKYVAHGVDDKASALSKADARDRRRLARDAIWLGCVARLHPLKQLDAAIAILAHRKEWRLALAGQGPDEARLRALADALGVADRVQFIGEIAPRDVGDFLAALDVFVFPSAAETFGLAAAEAASAGIPVVANDLSVLREVLSESDEAAALFVDVTNPAAFAATVGHLLDNAVLRERLRVAGRRLRLRYGVDAMVNDYVAILEETLGAEARGAAP